MKVVALVSGGKDSCYAMMKCIQYDHQIVALANLMPMDDAVDELDSYMYQTVGHQIIGSYAECMGVPLFRRRIKGSTRHQNLSYRFTPGDEVEDMFILLHSVKKRIPSVSAVCSGAIASDYQRLRVESVCSRLGLVSLAYLWKQDQALLIQEMITNGITAITLKVAAMGFVPSKHLGKEMAYLQPYLQKLKELYGINICGEGGEYETLTLDCPLFTNARIVLDDFEVVLHSSDSIAPVGVLHPLAFHLENKGVIMPNGDDRINDASVWEVEDGDLDGPEGALCATCVTDSIKMTEHKYKLSRTKNTGAFSLCCWGQAPGERPTVESVQEDLEAVLRRIESQLAKYGFGWQNVLYIHLYIADMNDFTTANETYIKFITHERCEYGVPSRSTIELPLVQANLGRAYVEVLVANDNSKRVLHVQSISCWAPSCIGPYSQATLHKGVLYMAGQLGLDPPTMNLCKGGPAAELEQALKNSEAVAKCFNCSLAASAILFVIYCSKNIPPLEKIKIPEKLDAFLKELRSHESDNDGVLERLNPICLYVLVPNLPKGALVEVKPFLFVGEDVEITSRTVNNNCKILASDWGFQHADWHDSCIQRCVIHGKICAVFLSVTKEISAKMSSECLVDNQADRNGQISLERGEEMGNVARFTLYLLDKILMENDFSWADIMTLRFYFPTSLAIPLETLSHKFHIAFSQLAGTGRRIDLGAEPIFNLVPVLGAGSSSALMDDIISCELFAQKT